MMHHPRGMRAKTNQSSQWLNSDARQRCRTDRAMLYFLPIFGPVSGRFTFLIHARFGRLTTWSPSTRVMNPAPREWRILKRGSTRGKEAPAHDAVNLSKSRWRPRIQSSPLSHLPRKPYLLIVAFMAFRLASTSTRNHLRLLTTQRVVGASTSARSQRRSVSHYNVSLAGLTEEQAEVRAAWMLCNPTLTVQSSRFIVPGSGPAVR